jgi:hypothetical protein
MTVTTTNFAMFIPDWNSLDSVRRAHGDLELAALVFFALLVLFDILAHFSEGKKREKLLERIGLCFFAIAVAAELAAYGYGQRNDALSDQKIRSLDAVSHDADITAKGAKVTADAAKIEADGAKATADQVFSVADNARLAASGALSIAGDAKAQVATVQSNIAAVDAKYAPRTLPKDKRDILIRFLRNTAIKPSSVVSVDTAVDAPDGSAYGQEIVDAINDPSTGWKAKSGNTWTSNGGSTVGVILLLPLTPSAQPPWAGELQQALRTAGIGGDGVSNAEVKAGEAVILVRRKN